FFESPLVSFELKPEHESTSASLPESTLCSRDRHPPVRSGCGANHVGRAPAPLRRACISCKSAGEPQFRAKQRPCAPDWMDAFCSADGTSAAQFLDRKQIRGASVRPAILQRMECLLQPHK